MLIALLTNHEDDVYCFRKELIEALAAEDYQLLISCPGGEKLALMREISFLHDDLKIDRRGTNPVRELQLFLHYLRLLGKHRPHVVLNFTVKPNVYGSIAAGILGIPTVNNLTGLGSIVNKEGPMKSMLLFLLKLAFRRSACVFFQNRENMALAKAKGLIKGPCRLIPGSGVNTDRFPLQPYPPEDVIVFNFIGRVMKEKGIDDYIEAARRIKEKHPYTEFNVIGFIEPRELHYEEEFRRLEEEGILFYRGNQQDVRPWISRSHATIHPSKYGEGMSNVLLESAASGRPLITTDISGCRETLEDYVTGYVYHAGDVEHLMEKLHQFLSLSQEERIQMGRLGREKVKEEFSRKVVVNAYLERIREIERGLE